MSETLSFSGGVNDRGTDFVVLRDADGKYTRLLDVLNAALAAQSEGQR